MAEKLFFSMGEVAEMFDVKPSLLRHWESQFSVIRPRRNKKGNRLFTPQDVENLKLIYHLVKEQGMTLEGAKKALRQQRGRSDMPRDAELMERLQRIRALLVEVREDLKAGEGEILADSDADMAVVAVEGPAPAARKPRRTRPVVKLPDGADLAAADAETPAAGDAADASGESSGAKTAVRRPRRKKEDAENKELFAFYEQSLF